MSRTEQQVRELYRNVRGMPAGQAKFAALEEVIRHADALGLVEFAFDVRMEATRVFVHGGVPAKAFLTFSWCLAAYDREPGRFAGHHEHSLLWQFKWMIYNAYQFPEIPLARTAELMDDMERRYRRGGHSMHAVLQHRGLLAESLGRLEEAQEYYQQMALTSRDSLSDCSGCVPSSQVRALVALGRDEEAIRVGEPARRSGCSEQPQWVNSELLLPYLRTGRGTQAVEAHRVAYRCVRDRPHHLGELALNVRFCAQSGNPGRGLDLIERHLSWLERPRSPLSEMEFAAAAVAVLAEVEARGEGGRLLRFPTVDGGRRPDTRVDQLAAELRVRALATAARFDARNGSGYQSDRIREWMSAGPIGEPVSLSPADRDLTVGADERIRHLFAQVGAHLSAGRPVEAARARAVVAAELLEEERFAEAVEAAEEAVRELDRLELAADAAACRWLLARAYREVGEWRAATAALRELLESAAAKTSWASWASAASSAGGAGLPPRPELEARFGKWLGWGSTEAPVWFLSAARGFAAAGRTADRLTALADALNRQPSADPEPDSGPFAELLAEIRTALDGLLGDGPAAVDDGLVQPAAALLRAYACHLDCIDRHQETVDRLRTARTLLERRPFAEAAGELGNILTELAEAHLALDAPEAAEEAARAAIALLGDPQKAWTEAIVLVRALRARGADEEAAEAMELYEVDEDDLGEDGDD
ncbi:hypothetical protein [Kitasatospora sp. NPDC097643]|uniref:hypothetical protein n=1 Tax=Kitasatospora sp. NPDC097643 TaxID=3157230 RepID=UPI00332479B6